MRRSIAILLGVALCSASAQVAALHTHGYAGHDHPEHHHGLAAHAHQAGSAHPPGGAPRLEPCDPGRHAISFVFACTALSQLPSLDVELASTTIAAAALTSHHPIDHADIRVHGPPPRPQASPRAPPVMFHA